MKDDSEYIIIYSKYIYNIIVDYNRIVRIVELKYNLYDFYLRSIIKKHNKR